MDSKVYDLQCFVAGNQKQPTLVAVAVCTTADTASTGNQPKCNTVWRQDRPGQSVRKVAHLLLSVVPAAQLRRQGWVMPLQGRNTHSLEESILSCRHHLSGVRAALPCKIHIDSGCLSSQSRNQGAS